MAGNALEAGISHNIEPLDSLTYGQLRVEKLTKKFGGVLAVDDVSFFIRPAEIVGLIGPNGSGKTTVFNCITGFLRAEPPSRIVWRNVDVSQRRPDQIARMGLVRTFQEVRAFLSLTVLEGLIMAVQQHQEDSIVARIVRSKAITRSEDEARHRAAELLEVVNLSEFAHQPISTLSFGQRKLYSFIAALMSKPALTLLDEPAAAINPVLIERILEYVKILNGRGMAFLIVEHNMDVVMELCHRVIVLDHGQVIAEGDPDAIREDDRVIDAYFGS